LHKKKIMVVDDDADLVEETAELLEMEGYEVASFTNGGEAERMLGETMPDLALIDIRMDGRSGFELANVITHGARTSHIPVLAMTGYRKEGDCRGLMHMVGIRETLGKPFSPECLLQVIDRLLKPQLVLTQGRSRCETDVGDMECRKRDCAKDIPGEQGGYVRRFHGSYANRPGANMMRLLKDSRRRVRQAGMGLRTLRRGA
jgi:CheY-like chemotaxis protein